MRKLPLLLIPCLLALPACGSSDDTNKQQLRAAFKKVMATNNSVEACGLLFSQQALQNGTSIAEQYKQCMDAAKADKSQKGNSQTLPPSQKELDSPIKMVDATHATITLPGGIVQQWTKFGNQWRMNFDDNS